MSNPKLLPIGSKNTRPNLEESLKNEIILSKLVSSLTIYYLNSCDFLTSV